MNNEQLDKFIELINFVEKEGKNYVWVAENIDLPRWPEYFIDAAPEVLGNKLAESGSDYKERLKNFYGMSDHDVEKVLLMPNSSLSCKPLKELIEYWRAFVNRKHWELSDQDHESIKSVPKSNPGHYASHRVKPIDLIEEYKLNFNLGNVIKYTARHAEKDGRADLCKALWYLLNELGLNHKEIEKLTARLETNQ